MADFLTGLSPRYRENRSGAHGNEKPMETEGLGLGIGLGCLLGASYALTSFLSNRIALQSARNPLAIIAGAMAIRIVVVLGLLVMALQWLPVSPIALLASFFVTFLTGLVIEIGLFHKKRPPVS